MGASVRLTVVEDEGAAEILCRALRAEGIACSYRRTDFGAGYSEGGYSFGGWREIFVDEADFARALEIFEGAEPVVEACVRCGHPIGGDGGWYRDEAGEFQPYCSVCAERLFGPF